MVCFVNLVASFASSLHDENNDTTSLSVGDSMLLLSSHGNAFMSPSRRIPFEANDENALSPLAKSFQIRVSKMSTANLKPQTKKVTKKELALQKVCQSVERKLSKIAQAPSGIPSLLRLANECLTKAAGLQKQYSHEGKF